MVQAKLVEALLSSIFSDPFCLGSCQILRDNSTAVLGELPLDTLVDAVSAKHRDCVSPSIRAEIEELVIKAEGDALRLLQIWISSPEALCEDPFDLDSGRFPTSAFVVSRRRIGIVRLGFQVADSHLHSGATMPGSLFLRSLGARMSPIPLERAPIGVSPLGGILHLGRLMSGLRWALRYQTFSVAKSGELRISSLLEDGFDSVHLKALRKSEFWQIVAAESIQEDTGAGGLDGPGQNIVCGTNRSFRTRISCPDITSLVWPSTESALDSGADLAFRMGVCRAITLVGNSISSSSGEGLSRFARRFDHWSQLKKLAVDQDFDSSGHRLERDYVSLALGDIAPSDEVVAAEFRKTFCEDSAEDFGSQVLSSLKAHHASFSSFSEGRLIDLTMPISFLRQPQVDRCPSRSGMVELQSVLYGVQAIARLRARPGGETIMKAIGSIDVVNDELGSTNWPFCLGAQLLALVAPELGFAIHAGESFFTEMNGLRRVGELYMSAPFPNRVGHALSLSEMAAPKIASRAVRPIGRADALMDLLWLANVSVEFRQRSLELIHILTVPTNGREAIDAAAWAEAFSDLHDITKVGRLLLKGAPGRTFDIIPEAERVDLFPHLSPKDRATYVLAGALPRSSQAVDFGIPLADYESLIYLRIQEEALSSLRAKVIEDCAANSIVEVCPTSNSRLVGFPRGLRDHPFGDVALSGVRKTVSSDDPIIFGTNVVEEISKLLSSGHHQDDVRAAARLSVETCAGGTISRPRGRGWYDRIVELCG